MQNKENIKINYDETKNIFLINYNDISVHFLENGNLDNQQNNKEKFLDLIFKLENTSQIEISIDNSEDLKEIIFKAENIKKWLEAFISEL